jgi:lipoprotein-anchoring transpeptidase ErfK/SrfK
MSAVVVADTLPITATTGTTATTAATTAATTTALPATTTAPPPARVKPKPKPKPKPPAPTRPMPNPPPPTALARAPVALPAHVRIANVPIGGLRPAAAVAAVRASFAVPLTVEVNGSRMRLTPRKYATAYITGAVARARASAAGTKVKLVVVVRGAAVRAFTAKLEERFDRPAVDARLSFAGGQPYVSAERAGHDLDQVATTSAIVRALARNTRVPLRFATTVVQPSVTRAGIGPVIVIDRERKRLDLYESTKLWRTFGVATGQSVYPTPSGTFSIVVMYRNPWWYPPTTSDWARGLKPVPPGPGNPLGTRWMGLSAAGVGIHGTPDSASIGYSASHGCIRMLIPDAEWLFDHVSIGTPVHIV